MDRQRPTGIADRARKGLPRRRRRSCSRRPTSTTQRQRVLAYEKAMGRVSQRRTSTTPKRASSGRWRRANGVADRQDLRATSCRPAEILEPLYKQMPNHPGLAHYIIHAYDVPALARQGAARGARATRTSRRRCRTRCTCRRTPLPASDSGRNRSPPTSRRRRKPRRPAAIGEALHALRLHDLRLPADGQDTQAKAECSVTP